MALAEVQRGAQRHVPYRDSRLTYLLQARAGTPAPNRTCVLLRPQCAACMRMGSALVCLTTRMSGLPMH